MLGQRPKHGISVVMPVFNAGEYLIPAVQSILEQQGVELELLLIDDHSTDNCLKQIDKDPRIRTELSSGKGIVSALNTGIESASMPWIARMDADDIAHPRRLLLQLEHCLNNPNIDICGTQVEIFKIEQEVAGGYLHYQEWINSLCSHDEIERSFFIESAIPHPTALFKRSLIKELGGYRESSWPEDYDLWCRAMLMGKRFGKPRVKNLLRWRDHSDRLSRSSVRYSKQQFLRCKSYYLAAYLKQRGQSEVVIWGAGKTGLKIHDYLAQEAVLTKMFIDINPKLRGRHKRDKPVHIAEQLNSQNWSLPETSNTIILIAVSARGAREKIRTLLKANKLIEQVDFICVA